jgi:hypothetical protein
MDTTKAKARTPEEIRDAARAEIPGLVTIHKRLGELYDELCRTPEFRRRRKLKDEDPAAWELNAVYWLAATLCKDDVGGALRDAIAHLRKDTSPAGWASEPSRSRKAFAEQKAREAREAKKEAREALGAVFGHISEALIPPS